MRWLLSILCLCLALGAPVTSGLALAVDSGEAASMAATDGSDEPAQSTETEDSPSSGDAALRLAPGAALPRAMKGDGWSTAPIPGSVDRAVPVPPPVG